MNKPTRTALSEGAPALARHYWIFSLFGCCFTLPAIYGLFSTTRATFRQLFEEAD